MPEEKKGEVEEMDGRKQSRREFIKNAGLMIGGATLGSAAIMSACSGGGTTTVTKPGTTATVTNTVVTTVTQSNSGTNTVTVTSPPVTVTATTDSGEVAEAIVHLNVNNDEISVLVRPNWTLQHVLNDKLDLIGAKEWCDAGACGSCTVIIDGRPVLSCMLLAIECGGRKIETVEGIAGSDHPLIEAYKKNNCMQCGYCTPGFICTAKALLDKNPNPTVDEIKDALSGNLCRCSTYPQHPIAVQEAATNLGGN